MSDEDPSEAALQEEIAELEAFEAQFKAADFAGVAEALRLAPEPETLSCLRRWLLPEFRFFIACCPGVQLSRDERIRRLQTLHDAATTLLSSIGPGGAWSLLSRKFLDPDLLSDRFSATVRSLADEATAQIRRLRASRDQAGRPRLEAFRQFGEDLIRVYRTIGEKTSVASDWDDFYRFARAACRCLERSMPAVVTDFPTSSRAMRDHLREVWNTKIAATENPSHSGPNKPS
jgi:hypothetical protein